MKQKCLGRWFVVVAAAVGILNIGVVGNSLAQKDGGPEYEDTFDTLDPVWGEATPQKFVQDGVLVIKPDAGYTVWPLNQGMFFEDGDISVRLRQVGGNNLSFGNGLIFWADSYKDMYRFGISSDGALVVLRNYKDKVLTPIPWRNSDAIKKGLDEWNELRVKTEGNQATLYINGTEILTFKGQPNGGMIGVFAASAEDEALTYEFDDLRVE